MNHSQKGSANVAATPVTTELTVSGMNCNNCVRHVTEAIQSVAGVRNGIVRLNENRATVRWANATETNVPAVVAAIKRAGYEAHPIETGETVHHRNGWNLSLWTGVTATASLMFGEWILGRGMEHGFQWLSFAVAGVVQIFAGAPFYRGAWRQLKVGSSNMDTLVALGSTTAFGYSAWALLSGQGGHVYFMEASAIITLISVGHWIEARVSAHASSALKSLLNLAPQIARRRNAAGGESEIPVADLQPADVVVLKPGDRIPTDGVVIEGDSAVDESMLTGESVPVDKSSNSELYAGTINLNGLLAMRVTATGESTALAHIITAVQRAQTSRANIQRLGDRVSNVFVPLVVLVAVVAGLWWGLSPGSANQVHDWLAQFLWPAHPPTGQLAAAFIIAAAVLIIACPCAMGLATPAAIMASANAAARRGILIRDGVAMEKAGQVTSIVFDKTGTLTAGKPAVLEIWEAEPAKKNLRLASTLASHSTHPISEAIAQMQEDKMDVTDWKEIHGAGVQAKVRTPDGEIKPAQLGSVKWLRESGGDLSAGENFIQEWTGRGATVVGLALGGSLKALIALQDTPKPDAAKVIAQLQQQGFKIHLLTGDNTRTAESIAAQVGIARENVFAEVRPEQKADFVKRLQQQGERVAFVGDGINDAPALEQADLGIAVGRASDVAREAADIILLRAEIEAVPEALGLARATLRTIKQNLFWAFFYNAIGVPLAALGFMSPVLCAAAMGFSDLIVIGNALRLRRWTLESKG